MPATSNLPKLSQFAALWSLEQHPSARAEWDLERKLAAVAEAGFAGVCSALDPVTDAPKLARHGLRLISLFNIQKKAQIKEHVTRQAEAGAEKIVIHLAKPETPVDKAVSLFVAIVEAGARHGVPVYLETHRATCTEDPRHFLAIAKEYRKQTGEYLPVNWDHSHLAVVQHIYPDAWESQLLRPKYLHQVSPTAHLRPFTGHHAQIPVTDPKGRLTPEMKSWTGFAERYFQLWLEGPRPTGELCVVPELGPKNSGYPLQDFPEIWSDTLVCQKAIARAWRKALRASQ